MAGGNIQFQPGRGAQGPVDPSQAAARRPSLQETLPENAAQQPRGQEPAARGVRAEEFSPEQLREVASAFGEAVTLINRGVRFRIDDQSEQIITQVVDRDTDEVIRQIPPQELLDISQRLRDFIGMLIDQRG